MVLARNPTYHGRFTGNLERVELTLLGKDLTEVALNMYEAGSLDVVDFGSLPASERDRAREQHAGDLVSGPTLSTRWVSCFPTGPPLDDVRVRRALVLATDRETLADVVLGGYEFPGTGGFVPPGMPGHSPGIGLPYDPVLARQLLSEAGYAGGRGLPPVEAVTWSPLYEDIFRYLEEQWLENIGVAITWQLVDLETYKSQCREPWLAQPHLYLSWWFADYPDPHNFLRVGEAGETRRPWGGVAHARLVDEASRVTDQAERMELYRQADRMLIEGAFIMPISYPLRHQLIKPWVARYPMSPVKHEFWKDVVIEPH
jgi:ABC-type transport system substrate-binding protein